VLAKARGVPVSYELAARTRQFAVCALKIGASLRVPRALEGTVVQFVNAGTAIGANYLAAGAGRSYREFTARLGVVAEEAIEAEYWLEVLSEALAPLPTDVTNALAEARQLRGIFVAGHSSAERRLREMEARKKRSRSG
jgi:four helix bundle protein